MYIYIYINVINYTDNGAGFMWTPSLLNVEVNDIVEWKWNSPAHFRGAVYRVLETDNEYTNYNGSGFASPGEPSQDGN